jgi:hypothetical protein
MVCGAARVLLWRAIAQSSSSSSSRLAFGATGLIISSRHALLPSCSCISRGLYLISRSISKRHAALHAYVLLSIPFVSRQVHTRWNNQQEQSARGRRSTSLAAAQHLINPARPGSSRSTKIRPATIAAYVSLRSTISATWRVAYICSILPNRSTQPRHRTHHRRRIQISNAYKYG